MQQPIPVVIVAGFLGSGKTTLLNHLLGNGAGARVGVVVNDFGSIGIDAMSVAGQVDSMVELGNGCLCCAVDAGGMERMLSRLARPGADLDVIVVESSGLADPRVMIRLVLACSDPRLSYGGLVEVVDAAEFETSRARHPELEQHLRFADLVVLNKTDRVEQTELDRLHATVGELAGGTPVLPTSHGRVDPSLLFEARPRTERDDVPRQLSFDELLREDEHARGCDEHMHAQYQSVEFESDRPLDPRALMGFLDDRPPGVYRMKGFVYFGLPGHRHKFALHTVGNYLRFHRTRWESGESRRSQLVAIGTGIDPDSLRERLESCAVDEPGGDDGLIDNGMLSVLRFTH
ncbi:G3E family GTPase [Saccharopolyspora erythraea NRRL 2338]|uniref:Cobalamin synthesis protein n=2 Tax=Saccharopolyspora erythraea TaxID=1836 RepID=A4FEU7_SACEN|nr:GTP-binding protein [Saccharopolyspora erythraea]EQD82476.1 cobalamin biosynthesis protein CobW [Saccharopolyspora erythraea D]PFG96297.1 G3E family GTPase [Saccharopolyspora erythraea NRRL 2338]QRK92816.1 GTP-binding protein [Saccharopolyspora erythraea]CAM02572.1 cobalamin synthesis protein [Saccharopolyspora erythraea NRRL 2338]